LYLPVVGRRGNLLGGLSRRTLREATQDHASAASPHDRSMLYHVAGALLLTCSALGTLFLRPGGTSAAAEGTQASK
ncbi:MAG TPA: hypothetical protein VLD39_03985, partial [Gammaproteobacteria bacterium]|nr:hypothetical protein [Gammaproteobacteria bacterium]